MLLAFLAVTQIGGTIQVPLDHTDPRAGSTSIYYEAAAPLDKRKPTLLVIADGQQFYVRKGRMATVAKSFGDGLNVVGIVGRGDAPEIAKRCRKTDGTADWSSAWRYFNSSQWVEDIEAVRRNLVGPRGKVLLYGVSGGAMLVHEYLARHGDHVSRAFTAAAVMPFLEGQFGRGVPAFMPSLERIDPALPSRMRQVLADHPEERAVLATAFQRQHFFVSAEGLPSARKKLIDDLTADFPATLARARKEYQVDAVLELARSDAGFPIAVREYEFLAAAGQTAPPSSEDFDPEFESQYGYAAPLMDLRRVGRIPLPAMDLKRLHAVQADVFVLAGTQDRAVDYLTSISLAARYPNGLLLLVDDNHVFARLEAANLKAPLIRSFLLDGPGSKAFRDAMRAIDNMK